LQPSLAGAAAGASTEQNRAEPSVPCFAPHKTELRGKKWWAHGGYGRFFLMMIATCSRHFGGKKEGIMTLSE
jgi:hypothetical protein